MRKLNFRQVVNLGLMAGGGMLVILGCLAMGAGFWQNKVGNSMIEHAEISRATDNVVSLMGFTSREMAHQVLAKTEEVAEQKGDMDDKHNQLKTAMAYLVQISANNSQAREVVQHVVEEMVLFNQHVTEVVKFASEGKKEEAFGIIDISEELEDDMLIDLQALGKDFRTASVDEQHTVETVFYMSMLTSALLMLTGLAINLFIGQKVTAYMASMAKRVKELVTSFDQVRDNISNVETMILNNESAVQEVSAAVTQFQDNINTICQQVMNTAKNAENILVQSQDSAESMSSLEVSSKDIQGVVAVIDSFADQTNLLALNATIEAARAGDAGRGFAVVADEVRKLSRHTSESTLKINLAVQSLLAKVVSSSDKVEKTSFFAKAIESETREVSSASQQQNACLTQIAESFQRFARDMTDMGGILKNLNQTSETMQSACSDLVRQVGRS